MPFRPKKQNRGRRSARPRTAKPSKTLKRAIKQVVSKQVETKTINCPDIPGGSTNSVAVTYGALAGIQYLVQDVFRQPQGTANSSVIGSGNRIGDKIKAVGMLMDYYFHMASNFNLGGTDYRIPFIKLRVTAFRTAFGSPLLGTSLVYDTNFLTGNTTTLQPINWNEGYVKDVLYDKVFTLKQFPTMASAAGPNLNLKETAVFHFKKYLKFPNLVKYCDNNTTSPNSTTMPIYLAITAEVDDANAGLIPSGSTLLNYTGYTRAWFKDA